MSAAFTIRPEKQGDAPAIRGVLEGAFDTPLEADLVDALRERAQPLVSLVGVIDGLIVGHVMCSPATLESMPDRLVMGLAPVAVVPGRQRAGIGSALVAASLEACRHLGTSVVVVLGHHDYYPRFGFAPARRFGLRCEYDVPDEAFMAIELERGVLHATRPAIVRYHPVFPRA